MIASNAVQITPEILSLIAGIDEFKGAWCALGTLAPDRLSALRRVATIESIGSSTRIEGSRLSDREVERLLANQQIKSFTTRGDAIRLTGGNSSRCWKPSTTPSGQPVPLELP